MGVVLANPHMQEAGELKGKLRWASNEEERKVLSREQKITETKIDLADYRRVRRRNLMWDHNNPSCYLPWTEH